MTMDHSSHAGHDMHHGHDMGHGGHAMPMPMMGEHNMDDMGGDNSSEPMVHMMMAMYFHGGYEETILFKFWEIDSIWELCLSMIGLFLIAFLYEGLKYCREFMFRKAIGNSKYTSSDRSNVAIADDSKPVRYMEQIIMPPALTMLSGQHIGQTFLHMLQFFVSYCLMLVFMTYNVWLCLACLLGSGVGYFVFGWRKSVVVDITEHCH